MNLIPVAEPNINGNEKKYVLDCLSSTWISSKGEYITRFENGFAKFIGTKYAIATSNGTTALHLALLALGIGKGDEVIVPDLTFVASANTVAYTGAKPIFVDVDRTTWNIDPQKIEKSITSKTRAIMVVHLYGNPADMEKIKSISQKHNLFIIEDAAEAHGAQIKIRNKWNKVGSIGHIGCFSFYGNKIITTGEGGIIVTNSKKYAEKMKILRDHGQDPKRRYYHRIIGYNYRMTNIQAAIGVAQLENIEAFIAKKIWIAKIYSLLLTNREGITLPPQVSWAKNVYWMYSVLINKPYSLSRDKLMSILLHHGIETRPFFYPITFLPPYKLKTNNSNTSYISKHGINLPSSVTLKEEQIYYICDIIKKYAI